MCALLCRKTSERDFRNELYLFERKDYTRKCVLIAPRPLVWRGVGVDTTYSTFTCVARASNNGVITDHVG